MARQMTQTHEKMLTLQKAQGREKGIEIHKTIQKGANWHCQERSINLHCLNIIAHSNGKGIVQKVLILFEHYCLQQWERHHAESFNFSCNIIACSNGKGVMQKVIFFL